ncbi:MAG: hypothetical protein M1434_07365 [Chloroflexi bacterium]|nr:hypothetical protein [Chloroflexota bacterium]MCL5274550.1 hypothetical protein [Chloroflexota bacterium]
MGHRLREDFIHTAPSTRPISAITLGLQVGEIASGRKPSIRSSTVEGMYQYSLEFSSVEV